MVASVAERGYWNTRVSDLTEISGVSLRSFYDLFADKDACFVATIEAILEGTVEFVLAQPREDDWEKDLRRRLTDLASLAATQSAAARMCLIETYVGGPAAAKLLDDSLVRVEAMIRDRFEATTRWSDLPPEMPRFAVIAFIDSFRSRLLKGQGRLLPEVAGEIATLLFTYEPPTRPLRSAARPPKARPEEQEASDHAERALRAFEALLAEQPFIETTMEQVAKRAKMSVRTLYANFAGREELMLAAIDSAGALVVAAALPAYRRADNPSDGVRGALGALFGLLGSRPNMANLLLSGAFEGGAAALQRRSEALWPLELLLMRAAPAPLAAARKVVSGAILGGLLGIARRRFLEAGAAGLPGLVQISTFIALAPLLGTESATAAAEGKSYRRPPLVVTGDEVRLAAINPLSDRLLVALSHGPVTVEQIAAEIELSPQEVELSLSRIEEEPLAELAVVEGENGERLYENRWPLLETPQWAEFSLEEQEQMSAEVQTLIHKEMEEATAAGTFDTRPERFLVRLPVRLDERGWQELHDSLATSMEECIEIQRRTQKRLEASGRLSETFSARVVLVSFEMPQRGHDEHS
ncbi:MAG: TetR/AcrR family transcriptional regulator [Solirubrobacterales bacterium]